MADWLSKLTDEQLKKRRENLNYLSCWLYVQYCTFDDEKDKTRYDDMMDLLKDADAEIERRKKNAGANHDSEQV